MGRRKVRTICKCVYCKTVFETNTCYLKRGGGKYCSRKCSDHVNYCSVKDCNMPCKGLGLCGKHYMRFRVHGDVNYVHSFKGSNNPMFGSNRVGKLNPFYGKKHSVEVIENNRIFHTGRKLSEEHKSKIIMNVPRGEKSPHWKGGPKNNKEIRLSGKYRKWSLDIKKRDDYTCQMCLKRGGILNSDHIKPFVFFPELRFELSNGRTLCVDCHKKTPTFKRKFYVEV